jgi:hypothetical protein
VNSSVEDLQNLHLHDVIVLNAGANDIYKNNKRVALTQITKFIQRNYSTNIILDIPQRYDLSLSSCVNYEIEEFHRKLKKIVTSYNHVSLLETNLTRECFVRHGLHWNYLGKALVVQPNFWQINKVIGKGFQTPISLIWKDSIMVDNIGSCNEERTSLVGNVNENVNVSSENINNNEQRKQQQEIGTDGINLRRPSVRQRKVPVTRREDFL